MLDDLMRGFRDRDFLQTNEGFFFCVVGPLHPPERVISYIKYVPSQTGLWGKNEEKFSRILQNYTIPNLLETFSFLQANYPHYIFDSPVENIKLTAVPHRNIKTHFKPEQKLDDLRRTETLDPLQSKVVGFARFLSELSGVPEGCFGVTGSILLGVHQPEFSDIDVTVYGSKESWALREALTENRNTLTKLKRLEGNALVEWCHRQAQKYPLSLKDAERIYERKWNLCFFEGTAVSIHSVKHELDLKTEWGDKEYQPVGHVTIRAMVSDNSDSLFLPAAYKIEDVEVLEGPQREPISEVVSYESLYDSIAENGEVILARGKLERILEKGNKKERYRVLVGSPEGGGKDYIKLK